MRIFFLHITLLHFLSLNLVNAQISTPKYANEYLAIGVGARALAMGNTQVAVADDVTAAYWNPARLYQIPTDYQFGLMHAEYFAGIANYDYAAASFKMDQKQTLAISLIRFAVDDIPDTRFLYDANGAINYDNIRFFSAADYALYLSYSRQLGLEGLSIGGSAKILYRSAGNFANAWGFGLDVGLYYERNQLQMGLMARDVTGTFTAWWHNAELLADVYQQSGNDIPLSSVELMLPRLVYGVAWNQSLPAKLQVLAAAEVDVTFDGQRNTLLAGNVVSLDPRAGLELNYNQLIFVRGGIGKWQQIKRFDGTTFWSFQPDFGLGFQWQNFAIDYALTDIGNTSEGLYSHVFSLRLGINKKTK